MTSMRPYTLPELLKEVEKRFIEKEEIIRELNRVPTKSLCDCSATTQCPLGRTASEERCSAIELRNQLNYVMAKVADLLVERHKPNEHNDRR